MKSDINPWKVQNLEEFMYYCCPECDERKQSRDSFLKHALGQHPNSKECLEEFSVKQEEITEENFYINDSTDRSYNNQIEENLNNYLNCYIKEEFEDNAEDQSSPIENEFSDHETEEKSDIKTHKVESNTNCDSDEIQSFKDEIKLENQKENIQQRLTLFKRKRVKKIRSIIAKPSKMKK